MTSAKFEYWTNKLCWYNGFTKPQGTFEVIGYIKSFAYNATSSDNPCIWELWYNPELQKILMKAEDILEVIPAPSSRICVLNDIEYLVCNRAVIKNPRNPSERRILFLTQSLSFLPDYRTYLTFDSSIITNQNEPMERFILRKLLPKLMMQQQMVSILDLSQNLLVPSPPVSINDHDDIREDISDMLVEHSLVI